MIFSPATFTFLRGLKRNNNKPWFEAHRAQYEAAVKAPMLELIEQMDVRFAVICPEIVGDPRRGMFRIHRDVRFSRDKSPYKTNVACWFRHRDGEGAGFYFHIEPGNSLFAAGLWMPERDVLGRLRDVLVENPRAFAKTLAWELDEDWMLKKMPRGYAPDHPAAKWLKYNSFTLSQLLTDAQVLSPKLPQLLSTRYKRLVPLVRWINGALGLKPADRR